MKINTTRASKEGHAFHEAWAARRALELLSSKDGLIAIAIEGLSSEDPEGVTDAATEIADITLYFGEGATFETCARLEVLQCKYSIAKASEPFVASDAAVTLKKFVKADEGLIKAHGANAVIAKVSYALVINRPVGLNFLTALAAAAEGRKLPAEDKAAVAQLTQIEAATGLKDAALAQFCTRLGFRAAAETPGSIRHGASRAIADWSAAEDALSKLRLRHLCHLAREKAGIAGEGDNLIRRVDVLGALEVGHEDDLLPAKPSFADVGDVVVRAELTSVAVRIRAADKPVLLKATGGVGKTVFMQSLANAFADGDRTILFDCFGGGAYRSPEDERHLARRGLMHIVNELAALSLCDVILPDSSDGRKVLEAARARFAQAVRALRVSSPSACLIILIDAADNAAVQADDRHERSFPTDLLQAFALKPEEGVRIVASCRPNRAALTTNGADVIAIDLDVFTEAEARAFIAKRVEDASEAEIATALARSLRNPRVLAHLVSDWENLVRAPESLAPIEVETLIAARVDRAIAAAGLAGAEPDTVLHFLAGLTLLPTPIPIAPFATALDVSGYEISNFCADLAPLLEQGAQGVSFRDEPTETYIRGRFAAAGVAAGVAERLTRAQATSLYAARALPRVLQIAGDADGAIALALSDVMPEGLVSEVGKRDLQAARVSAAIAMAAKTKNADHLVTLLVEMSGLAAVNSRGDDYLSAHPDLVYLSGDEESLRRLLENRSGWQGRRHARAAVARALWGDRDEALTHARRAWEWRRWFFDLDENERYRKHDYPDAGDYASTPFFLATDKRPDDALEDLNVWLPGFQFEVAQQLVVYLDAHPDGLSILESLVASDVPCLGFAAAALSGGALLSRAQEERLIAQIAEAAIELKPAETYHDQESRRGLTPAMTVAAARAMVLGQGDAARAILKAVPITRASIYDFQHERLMPAHASLMLAPIVRAWAHGKPVAIRDLLPREIALHIDDADPADSDALIAAIDKASEAAKARGAAEQTKYARDDAETFKRGGGVSSVMRLHELANELLAPIADAALSDDAAIAKLTAIWRAGRVVHQRYRDSPPIERLPDAFCRAVTFFFMHVRRGFSAATAKDVISIGEGDEGGRALGADHVFTLARVPEGREAAGALAKCAALVIETEDFPTHRGSGFARLAHAILPASRAEAAAYFIRGLRELDTIGAGDYALIQELMWLTSKLKGAHLSPVHGQRLMNLCAVNFGDEPAKFPWGAFAAACANGVGANALGQLSRWDMRGDASFSDTLAPALLSFLETNVFSPAQALALLMLDEPSENWAWRLSGLLDVLLTRAPSAERAGVFLEFMRQLRVCEPDGVSPLTLEAIVPIVDKYAELAARRADLSAETRASRRQSNEENNRANNRPSDVKEAAAAAQRERDGESERRTILEIAANTDPASVEAIDAALEEVSQCNIVYPVQKILLTALRDATPYAKRMQHIDALTKLTRIHLHERLDALEASVSAWSATAIAIETKRAELAERVIDAAGDEVLDAQYGFSAYIAQLGRISGAPSASIAMRLISLAADHGVQFQASTWLELASRVAEQTDGASLRAALTRLLDSPSAKLADSRFDGVYQPSFAVEGTSPEIVARLIWQRLGSPSAAERWRAAHGVRVLARYKCLDELAALVALFASGGLGAFGDAKIKVHLHNARLWLLIALARAAMEHPDAIASHHAFLEGVVADAKTHHVVMRGFAARALDAIYAWRGGMDAERAKLANVTKALLPRSQSTKDRYWRADRERADFRSDGFHFAYEFDKTDIVGVGDVFQLSHAEVERLLLEAVAEIDVDATGMHDGGGRRDAGDGWSRRGGGPSSVYGEQLAWHALITVAGRLAVTHAIPEGRWEDPWDAWLKDKSLTRADGLWLSDGADLYPAFARAPVMTRQKKSGVGVPKDERVIAMAAGLVRVAPDWIMIDGAWESSDGVRVTVHSALLPRQGAFHAARKLAGGPPFKLWAPFLKGDDERSEHHEASPLTPWIVEANKEPYLDDYDPFGVRTVNERSRWSKALIERFALAASDPFGRTWIDDKGETVLRALAWGKRRGAGRHELYEASSSLECAREPLLAYLRDSEQSLFVIVTLDYRPRDRAEAMDRKPDKARAVAVVSGVGRATLLCCRREKEPRRRRSRPSKAVRQRRRAQKQEQEDFLATYLKNMTDEQLATLQQALADADAEEAADEADPAAPQP